jgi:quinol monooxygenase YgiN
MANLVKQSDPTARRFRVLLAELIGKCVTEMGNNTFGLMVQPFLPMIFPVIEKMNDETALSILDFLQTKIHEVKGEA